MQVIVTGMRPLDHNTVNRFPLRSHPPVFDLHRRLGRNTYFPTKIEGQRPKVHVRVEKSTDGYQDAPQRCTRPTSPSTG